MGSEIREPIMDIPASAEARTHRRARLQGAGIKLIIFIFRERPLCIWASAALRKVDSHRRLRPKCIREADRSAGPMESASTRGTMMEEGSSGRKTVKIFMVTFNPIVSQCRGSEKQQLSNILQSSEYWVAASEDRRTNKQQLKRRSGTGAAQAQATNDFHPILFWCRINLH